MNITYAKILQNLQLQSTPDNSNPQGKSKKVITELKEKSREFPRKKKTFYYGGTLQEILRKDLKRATKNEQTFLKPF